MSDIDWIIKKEIIDSHEDGFVAFNGYNEDTDLDTELLVSTPHDDLYLKWLEAKIDYYNNEYKKYNNSSVAFNDAYSMFERYYNRSHLPKTAKLKFF